MRVLLWLAALDVFVCPEIESILSLHSMTLEDIGLTEHKRRGIEKDEQVFVEVDMPSVAVAEAVFSRCFTVKRTYELLGSGATYDEINADVLANGRLERFASPDQTFCINVDAHHRKLNLTHKNERRAKLATSLFAVLQGPIDVHHATNTFELVESHAAKHRPPLGLRAVFLGIPIGTSPRSIIEELRLRTRSYLGPTSLAPDIAMLMANQGRVGPGMFVYDPFVGTGSVAIAVAKLGGFVLGGDLDMRVFMGKQGRDPVSNSRQYGLCLPEMMLVDNFRPALRAGTRFDAIVCDPPYGIRAGARKSGYHPARKHSKPLPPGHPYNTAVYESGDVMRDLLDLAARHLVVGGRLVYLLPCVRAVYRDDDLPKHPCLKLLYSCEEVLSKLLARRVITMEKVQEFDPAKVEEYAAVAARTSEAAYTDMVEQVWDAKGGKGARTPKLSRREKRQQRDAAGGGAGAGAGAGVGAVAAAAGPRLRGGGPLGNGSLSRKFKLSRPLAGGVGVLDIRRNMWEHTRAEDRPVGNAPFTHINTLPIARRNAASK